MSAKQQMKCSHVSSDDLGSHAPKHDNETIRCWRADEYDMQHDKLPLQLSSRKAMPCAEAGYELLPPLLQESKAM